MKPKIFVLITGNWGSDISCSALAEDGTVLAGHVSSGIGWARHDMGIQENGWQRDKYAAHYPDGFEVVDLLEATPEEIKANPEYMAALARNREKRMPEPSDAR